MAAINPGSIDEYIARFPKEVQVLLTQIREVIREVAPEAEERISYDMPTFNIEGKYLIYFAAWKKHIALYPVNGKVSENLKEELSGYKSTKGSVHFPLSQPIPLHLIRRITELRLLERKGELQKI